ncbi:MAG: M24 family metallopeptidase [Rhizobiaceae bacterium]|nr:M24 family metallopeptidase [Rhizobiaceae bacterium]
MQNFNSIDPSTNMHQLMQLNNGEKAWSPFSSSEMDRRQNAMRHHMAENDIHCVILTSYHCINYYTGFLYCYFGRKYACVIDSQNTTTLSAGIDGGQPGRMTHGENVTYTDWRRDNFFHGLREIIGQSPASGKIRIGVEFDHLNLEYLEALKETFPNAEFIDVAQASMWMRSLKSDEEIELITISANIADIGGKACVDAIHAGVAEHEVALASTSAMVKEIANRFPHVELMDTWTWFQSGINTDGAHNPVTNKKVQSGDILSLNCFPMMFGYYTALERTLFCDHASDEHLRLWEINCDVHRAGLKLLLPGNKCSDIAKSLNEIYASHDLLKYRSFGYGHSFGVLSHYYGREAGVELREDVDTVLQPGMVVSMEPMIMVPEGIAGAGGYREHDILVIGESGATNITGFPFGPDHNIII